MKKIILITGASRGLGLKLAQELARLPEFIIYGTFNKTKPLSSRNLKYLKMDLRSDKSCKDAIGKLCKNEKRIDILVNCAGISPSGSTINATVDEFIDALQINTIGPFRVIKQSLPYMPKGGLIINITSLNGFVSLPHSGIYSASKFGLEALGHALHIELKEKRINLINFAPGTIYQDDEEDKFSLRDKLPLLNVIMPKTFQNLVVKKLIFLIRKNPNVPRVIFGRDAQIMNLFNRFLPFSINSQLINFIWQKRK